jgi:hypothetical protein
MILHSATLHLEVLPLLIKLTGEFPTLTSSQTFLLDVMHHSLIHVLPR